MFETRQLTDLMQIAAAGGGFTLNAGTRPTTDLMQIASAAARSGAKLTFKGLQNRQTLELMQIASAGKGNVRFEE